MCWIFKTSALNIWEDTFNPYQIKYRGNQVIVLWIHSWQSALQGVSLHENFLNWASSLKSLLRAGRYLFGSCLKWLDYSNNSLQESWSLSKPKEISTWSCLASSGFLLPSSAVQWHNRTSWYQSTWLGSNWQVTNHTNPGELLSFEFVCVESTSSLFYNCFKEQIR